MLLSKVVEVLLTPRTMRYYEIKGYVIPKTYDNRGRLRTKRGSKIIVKVEDLMENSHEIVLVRCDCSNCKNPINSVIWENYNKYIKENGQYYCHSCAMKIYGGEHISKTYLDKNETTLEKWCIENNRQDILDRWDYERNKQKPCEIYYTSTKKYWLKCPLGIHKSELKNIYLLITNKQKNIDCKKCNSIAQFLINTCGINALDLYWDWEKNDKLSINPWEISYGSKKKIWIKCQEKDYHESYMLPCQCFSRGDRCPYCSSRNGSVHSLDSLASKHPKVIQVWSDKNKKSPFEYTPFSSEEVWWKCHNDSHGDYKRRISTSNMRDFYCPECSNSKGEAKICDTLIRNNIIYIPQKSFDGLIGVRCGKLMYDFYLPKLNILIEYQGEFHNGGGNFFTKLNLEQQQEHDRRKRQYAYDHGIKLLEIWYWDFDNIEEILKNELNIDKELKPCS